MRCNGEIHREKNTLVARLLRHFLRNSVTTNFRRILLFNSEVIPKKRKFFQRTDGEQVGKYVDFLLTSLSCRRLPREKNFWGSSSFLKISIIISDKDTRGTFAQINVIRTYYKAEKQKPNYRQKKKQVVVSSTTTLKSENRMLKKKYKTTTTQSLTSIGHKPEKRQFFKIWNKKYTRPLDDQLAGDKNATVKKSDR